MTGGAVVNFCESEIDVDSREGEALVALTTAAETHGSAGASPGFAHLIPI